MSVSTYSEITLTQITNKSINLHTRIVQFLFVLYKCGGTISKVKCILQGEPKNNNV